MTDSIGNFMEEINYKIAFTVTEEYDRFVFSTISDWLFKDYKYVVSKKLIIESLKYFKEHEPKKYKFLSEQVLDENKGV